MKHDQFGYFPVFLKYLAVQSTNIFSSKPGKINIQWLANSASPSKYCLKRTNQIFKFKIMYAMYDMKVYVWNVNLSQVASANSPQINSSTTNLKFNIYYVIKFYRTILINIMKWVDATSVTQEIRIAARNAKHPLESSLM
jgi:hypothetical protein